MVIDHWCSASTIEEVEGEAGDDINCGGNGGNASVKWQLRKSHGNQWNHFLNFSICGVERRRQGRYDRTRRESRLATNKLDSKDGNWWMQFSSDYVLGYWPSFLFSCLAHSASMIEWGWRGGEFRARRAAHFHPDGKWSFSCRRIRKGKLFQDYSSSG